MRTLRAALISALTVVASAHAADTSKTPPVPYPEGYRTWQHVKSMVINPGHPLYESFGGIHHIYGNAAAMKGYATGKFEDEAVIVFDLLDAKADGNAVVEGARKVLGVMRKDGAAYRATGGWGYEAFKGNSRTERVVAGNAEKACHACHVQKQASGYVFSTLRE